MTAAIVVYVTLCMGVWMSVRLGNNRRISVRTVGGFNVNDHVELLVNFNNSIYMLSRENCIMRK